MDPALRDRALVLHRHLSRFLHRSDPWMLRDAGLSDSDLPAGSDWHWRPCLLRGPIRPAAIAAPASGHRLGEDAALWHDCPHRALILRQSVRPQPGKGACHPLQIEILGCAGSFVSVAVDLPDDILDNLGPDRILRADMAIDAERPMTLYARINLRQGPNTETMLRQLGDPVAGRDTRRVDFDLACAGLDPRPIQRAWLDIILEQPRMNAVTLCDIVLSHRRRAAF